VTVEDEVVGEIGPGLCVLVGVTHDDDEAAAARLADKVWRLRVFDDADGVMNLAASDVGAELLVVSQFTLYGETTVPSRCCSRSDPPPTGVGGGCGGRRAQPVPWLVTSQAALGPSATGRRARPLHRNPFGTREAGR
jgi:hypothetical protein